MHSMFLAAKYLKVGEDELLERGSRVRRGVQRVGLVVADAMQRVVVDVVQRVVEELPPMPEDSPRVAVAVAVDVDVDVESPLQIHPHQVPDVDVADARTARTAPDVAAWAATARVRHSKCFVVSSLLKLKRSKRILRWRTTLCVNNRYSILDTRLIFLCPILDTRYSQKKNKHVILDS